MYAALVATILCLVPYDAPQRPTPAPQPELEVWCLWGWDDGERVVHTIGETREGAKPRWQMSFVRGMVNGQVVWSFTGPYFRCLSRTPFRELRQREWREARRVPANRANRN